MIDLKQKYYDLLSKATPIVKSTLSNIGKTLPPVQAYNAVKQIIKAPIVQQGLNYYKNNGGFQGALQRTKQTYKENPASLNIFQTPEFQKLGIQPLTGAVKSAVKFSPAYQSLRAIKGNPVTPKEYVKDFAGVAKGVGALTMGTGGLLGGAAIGAITNPKNPIEGALSGIDMTEQYGGLTRFSNPIISRLAPASLLTKSGIGGKAIQGGLNVVENMAQNIATGRPLTEGNLIALGMGATGNQFTPNAKGFTVGRSSKTPWTSEDIKIVEGISDFLRSGEKTTSELKNKVYTNINDLADAYLPKSTIDKVIKKFKEQDAITNGLVGELKKVMYRSEDAGNVIKMGIIDQSTKGVEVPTSLKSPELTTPTEKSMQEEIQNMLKGQGDQTGTNKTEIPSNKKNLLTQQPSQSTYDSSLPQRKFAESVSENKKTPEVLRAELDKIRYNPLSNKETLKYADDLIKKSEGEALAYAKNGTDTNANAVSLRLIEKYIDQGRLVEANELVNAVAPRFTKAGQQIQILSAYGKLTPTGAIKHAQNLINQANKANPRLNLKLTEENTKAIVETAKKIKGLPEGSRDRVVAIATLMQKINDIIPASIGQKLSAIQTMGQLLNVKTAVRNTLGNAIFTGMENISDVVGSGLDTLTSIVTGQRSKVLPSLSAQAGGLKRGFKEGMEDLKLGIDTSGGVGTQFDINTKTFTSGVLSKLEKALNFELRVPDRAAYTAAFEGSLNNQMRAMGVNKPTEQMLELAHLDGLYRTFQDNSKFAQFFSGTKKLLNKIGTPDGKFGLGDFLLKYPKTPANILSRGLDYSPVGFTKGIFEAVRPLFTGQPFNQKAFVESMSRAAVGTGIMALGYELAKNGIISGKAEKDYDIQQLQRTTGQGAFKINVSALKRYVQSGGQKQDAQNGDTLVSYDWAQPTSLSLAMGANMANGGGTIKGINAAIDSYQSSVDTLTAQPMVKGLMDFAGDVKNKGIVGAGTKLLGNMPSSFVPTAVRQVSNLTDPLQRSTYDPNLLNESFNKLKVGIPGVRNTLEPKIDVLGQEMANYEGKGLQRAFDIFVNPAFITKVKENPAAKEVIDIYQRSGEVQQTPRIAPEKVKINGKDMELTPEQYKKYQTYIGQKTDALFNGFVNDPVFKNATDEDKAKFMANALTDINSAAKIELFGNVTKNTSDNVKRIVGGGTTTDSSLGRVGITTDGNLKMTGGAIEKPKLTGNSIVDKKLISGYNSDINAQQKDLINLYNSGQLTAGELSDQIQKLEIKKIRSKKAKKLKIPKIKIAKIKIKKSKIPKIKKPKKIKVRKIKIKYPKLT